MLTIIDTGIANVGSFQYKLYNYGIESKIAINTADIRKATKLILPGVGHFKTGINSIHNKGIFDQLNKKVLEEKTPIIGICLGMQLFTKHSEEGNIRGLGWIDAETKKFDFSDQKIKIPHVGWSKIAKKKKTSLLKDIDDDHKFYFTHSYYVYCNDLKDRVATAEYGLEFCAIFNNENIFGTQFHPEKSHEAGFNVLINFIKYV